MTEPLVCAIMLTKDRPEMARRAVASFRAQTYANKRLIIWDTGASPQTDGFEDREVWAADVDVEACAGFTIGSLRNYANKYAAYHYHMGREHPEIFIHFDDDDYSHPNRIAEQVELLKSSGADCVGYNEVLFWRTPQEEAWIYRSPRMSPAIGSSLCYWRSTWERRPFADAPKAQGATSEYYEWLRHCKVVAERGEKHETGQYVPRLICSIHGGNTQCYDIEALIAQGSREWTRAQVLDGYTRKVMTL